MIDIFFSAIDTLFTSIALIALIVILILILIRFIVALKFEKIAFQKGYDKKIHSFAMCFWLGIIGYLYVIALPNLNTHPTVETQEEMDYICPTCQSVLAKGAAHCTKCGQPIEWDT